MQTNVERAASGWRFRSIIIQRDVTFFLREPQNVIWKNKENCLVNERFYEPDEHPEYFIDT
jgi:hypothetical protein